MASVAPFSLANLRKLLTDKAVQGGVQQLAKTAKAQSSAQRKAGLNVVQEPHIPSKTLNSVSCAQVDNEDRNCTDVDSQDSSPTPLSFAAVSAPRSTPTSPLNASGTRKRRLATDEDDQFTPIPSPLSFSSVILRPSSRPYSVQSLRANSRAAVGAAARDFVTAGRIRGAADELRELAAQTPPPKRQYKGLSAIRASDYAAIIECDLHEDRIPRSRRQQFLKRKVRALLSKGVKIEERLVKNGDLLPEKRLIDDRNRMILKKDELRETVSNAFHSTAVPTSAATLLRTVNTDCAGVDSRKVARVYDEIPNTKIRPPGQPFEPPKRHIIADRPMRQVQVDLTKLPRTHSGGHFFAGILSFVCIHSRFKFARAVSGESAYEIARVFNDFCCWFGVPEILHCDNGPGFRSNLLRYTVRHLGGHLRFSQAYCPNQNGTSESSHKKLKDKVIEWSTRTCGNVYKWPEFVSTATRQTNIEKHSAFGHHLSPFNVMFGREENSMVGGDVLLLDGRYQQACERLTIAEQVEATAVLPEYEDVFGDGTALTLHKYETLDDTDDDFGIKCMYAVQEELEHVQLASIFHRGQKMRVGLTEVGRTIYTEATLARRQVFEFYRQLLESVLKKTYSKASTFEELLGNSADADVRRYVEQHELLFNEIRNETAERQKKYYEKLDRGHETKMSAPYLPGDDVYVAPLLSGRGLEGPAAKRAVTRQFSGTVRTYDAKAPFFSYLVEVTLDGDASAKLGLPNVFSAWYPPASLKPASRQTARCRFFGVTDNIPGNCCEIVDNAYCVHRSGTNCKNGKCAEHCQEDLGGYCGLHFGGNRQFARYYIPFIGEEQS